MRTRFDQLAKGILDRALSFAGEVRTQEEIAGEVQAADVWFRPMPDKTGARARLGLLGRMAETSCLIEPFRDTPGPAAVLDCVNKQLTLRRKLAREARKDQREAEAPRLWVLSSGRPRSALSGLRCEPLDGWPPGVWHGPPLLATYVVVLRDLPRTRETLLLRLLGDSSILRNAAAEVRALPPDDLEPRELLPLLLAYRVQIDQDPNTSSEDDMGYADVLQEIYDDWERHLRQQSEERGEERGMEKGMRELLAGTYEARFGAMPVELRAALEATTEITTLRRWVGLFATASASEIAAAVLTAART
jgi:hypothetical protein